MFILVSILLFSLLAGQDLIISILGRILLIPVIAAVAYEVLRWGAKRRENWAVRWLFLPGIWLQAITTKQPDDSMIEVAIASMHEALAANGETAPEGSLDPGAGARCPTRRRWPGKSRPARLMRALRPPQRRTYRRTRSADDQASRTAAAAGSDGTGS